MKKILILSAYKSDSHASWVRALSNQSDAEVRVLELPGRYFRWRIRGNPLGWLDELPALLQDFTPDEIIATSMVDLVTLKGLFPQIAHIPTTYYFHENQFAYPVGAGQHSSIDPMMVQLYGALAADRCQFNSHYNLRTFLEGVENLMRKMPDHKPNDLHARLAPKCSVVPVPITPIKALPKIPGLILWSHRWEYDKNPELFYDILKRLKQQGVYFRLALLGPRPDKTPDVLVRIRAEFAEHILADGMLPRAEYERMVGQSHIVISTAIHEFQGLSVQEAVSAGAIPVVPDDLCYVEQYPAENRYKAGGVDCAILILKDKYLRN